MAGISVIIPTMCSSQRRHSLWRAIDSVLSQEGVDVEVIVVVNGDNYDRDLFEEIKASPRLNVHYLAEGSLPAAIRYGRTLVTREYFSFLDDDDEYLPGALNKRISPFQEDSMLDVVVTNGFGYTNEDKQRVETSEFTNAQHEPLMSLLNGNWLSSCGALYRSESIDVSYFDGVTKYFEWTLVAFRIALDKRNILFINEPTYRVHDTQESISKTQSYRDAAAGFVEHLLTFEMPPAMREGLLKKLSHELHNLSDYYLHACDVRRAWSLHVRSLKYPGGVKYLAYTRRIFYTAIKKCFSSGSQVK